MEIVSRCMPKNILIVGMARSGTSLTASIFANNGYFLAKDVEKELKKGNEFNPTGFFEAETVIEKNREIYKAIGYQADNTWMFEPIEPKHVDTLKNLKPLSGHEELVAFYNSRSPWVWKDPRLCYTLHYWWQLMDENTAVLLVKRKPEAIYNSFLRTGWISATKEHKRQTYDRIDQHILQAEKTLKALNIPYVEIDYSEYRDAPQALCKKLNEGFGLNLKVTDLNYDDAYNHSSFVGKLSTRLDLMLNKLPKHWIHTLKKVVPTGLINLFFPERKRS